ncbi:glycosyltransferase family 8 protein [Periconia macrospinosa]|uniref:Glycosyltransferase family 8 protein n=1 Tax=Periconia macrospinosa TaxID=97972 RepID=A0A2V1E928_9PLEO|nr:glycosyltransferase family 8 protein [Periconia macrospinosa]
MRRRRSDELPRYLRDRETHSFRWPRRYWAYLAVFLFVCWVMYPTHTASNDGKANAVNWSNFAYSLYATDSATLCHAVLLFNALEKLGSKADRVLFYPEYWDLIIHSKTDRDSQLLVEAKNRYNVKLQPIELLSVEGRTEDAWLNTWDKSVTKFMAFSLTYYERVIALDSDITLLSSLDDLFLLPPTPIAMPRAYWYNNKPWPLTSLLMVIKPSEDEFVRFKNVISGGGNPMLVDAHKFDMELINDRFEYSAMVLPHRPYAMLSGEFRKHNHSAYLGNTFEEWDPAAALKEAKLVHFSDWPLPKPWIMWPQEGLAEIQPDCDGSHEGSCENRRIWKELYNDFRQRRKDICGYLSVPAPTWHSIKALPHGDNATEGTGHEAPRVEDDKSATKSSGSA